MLKFHLSKFFLSFLVFPANFIMIFSLIGLGMTGRSAQSTVSSGDSLKAGSFIEAVKKGDISLLEERIRARLSGPFSDFIKELVFTTKERRNIFHYLAGVETKQEEFAVILEGLIRLVYPSFFPNISATVTLAGITFSPETSPDPDLLFGTDDIQQKIEELYKDSSALSALAYLHRRTETGDLLLTALYRNHLKSLKKGKGGDLKDSYLDNNFKVFHLAEDNQNISPRQLAAYNKNQPALDVLNNRQMKLSPDDKLLARIGNGAAIGMAAGTVAGLLAAIVSPVSDPSYTVLGFGFGAGGGAFIALITYHDLFLSVKRKKPRGT